MKLIIAANHQHATHMARELKLARAEWRYVDDERVILRTRPHRTVELLWYETWGEHPRSREIWQAAWARGFFTP